MSGQENWSIKWLCQKKDIVQKIDFAYCGIDENGQTYLPSLLERICLKLVKIIYPN